MKRYLIYVMVIMYPFLFTKCKFNFVKQPAQAETNQVIEIKLQVNDSLVPEVNQHKGVLCVLVPDDWEFISANYNFDLGSGELLLSEEWADSANMCYAPETYGEGMKWIGLISDSGYAYENPIDIDVELKLKTGNKLGCFKLGYLLTKATGGLICSGNTTWASFSYPHRIGIPDSTCCDEGYKIREAREWGDLFDRQSGWTGADGIYSIPINGSEKTKELNSTDHLIVFSDTFIGEVDANNKRQNSKIVNNTYAYLKGSDPVENNVEFFWDDSSQNSPAAVFIPDTPEAETGSWYWLMDGVSIKGKIYLFALRLTKGDGSLFDFKLTGVNLIKFDINSDGKISNVEQLDTPLFLNNDKGEMALGQAVMPMHSESGQPAADGYIYIYGPISTPGNKHLVAARVEADNIDDFTKYRYWDGTDWTDDVNSIAPITDRISQEFSLTQWGVDKYILTFQTGNDVAIRIGESPVGPFDFYEMIYQTPDGIDNPNTFVYNAKAHPSLSEGDELLISYNVNTFSLTELVNDADIYRPRFIWLKLGENITGLNDFDEHKSNDAIALLHNYPNPFNASTNINFSITDNSSISIEIYNSLGCRIKTLIDNEFLEEGQHSIRWNADNFSSGVYYAKLKTNKVTETLKLILIK